VRLCDVVQEQERGNKADKAKGMRECGGKGRERERAARRGASGIYCYEGTVLYCTRQAAHLSRGTRHWPGQARACSDDDVETVADAVGSKIEQCKPT